MPRGGRDERVPGRLAVIVGVDVDETRRDHQARRIDLAPALAELGADGGDPAVLHGDIGHAARRAGAVENGSVSDDEVKHGPRIGRGLPAGLCSQPRQAIASGGPTFAETASLLAVEAARRHRAQPLRRLAHGAVPRHRRAGERLPSGPSRQVRAGQVRHRLHRELRHRAARPGHPGRSRHVGRQPDRGPQAAGAVPEAGGRARRHPDHPFRPQGQHAALVRQAGPARARRRGLAEVAGGRSLRAAGRQGLDDPPSARGVRHRRPGQEVRRGGASAPMPRATT